MKMRSFAVVVLVLLCITMASAFVMATVPAEGYDPADGMYVKAQSDWYWEGRYSNGRVFAEYIANELADGFENLENYAVGGAFSGVLTGDVDAGTDRSNWSSWLKGWGGVEQTLTFLDDHEGVAPSDGLYIISTGSNDSYAVGAYDLATVVGMSADNTVTMIDNLATAGATDFIVMLVETKAGKTENAFSAAQRAATIAAVEAYMLENEDVNIAIVDNDNLYENMEDQGMTAYGYRTWGFYQISDWVPAYGYALACNDNSNLLPTNATEDIYGYGNYYAGDNLDYYYTPETADYEIDEYLYYDEYHVTNNTHKHIASYILDSDITNDDDSTFSMVYNGTASAFASSDMIDNTYSMVYTFGDSTIDSGRAKEVTTALVEGREEQSKSISDMTDTNNNCWYTTYVNYVLQVGLMNGTSADTFSPGVAMTRAQLVTILGRADGVADSSAENPANETFTDVNTSAYYASHVEWAYDNGIINGMGNDMFAPNEYISRQDMAKVIGLFAEYAEIDLPTLESGDPFAFTDDADIKDYAKSYVYQLNAADILVGCDGAFNPTGNTTRAAAAKVLAMLLNYQMAG